MSPEKAAPTLAGAVAARLLDRPLAALAWLLLERGVPVLVAGRGPAVPGALADALGGALPPERRPAAGGGGERLVRVAGTLSADSPPGVLRAALAATTARSGLVATVEAGDLAGVLTVLARQGLADDEATFLGCVLVLGSAAGDRGRAADVHEGGPGPAAGGSERVVAAHYLRPVVRDAGGHPRRLGPAVLATWDPQGDRWEDFSWGVVPDLAERCRMAPRDFEVERGRRAALLGGIGGPLGTAGGPSGIARGASERPRPAPPTAPARRTTARRPAG